MKKVRVGLGRFYNGNFVKLEEGKNIHLKIGLKEYHVQIRISDTTRHVLTAFEFSPPVPKDPAVEKPKSKQKTMTSPGPEKFPADLYIEIVASTEIEVPDDIFTQFQEKNNEVREAVFKLAAPHNKDLTLVLDFAAGLLGLRVDPELVSVPILDEEQEYVYRENNSYGFGRSMKIVVKNPVIMNASKDGQLYLRDRICNIKRKTLNWEPMAEALGWMLRGWAAEDKVLKFVSFFTALESIIPKSDNPVMVLFENNKLRALEIAKKVCDAGDATFLKKFLQDLPPKSPLSDSFEYWASKSGLKGWQKDVKYFRKYNRARNVLLHSGELSGIDQEPIKGADVITLERIASRYISYWIFGEANDYKPDVPGS